MHLRLGGRLTSKLPILLGTKKHPPANAGGWHHFKNLTGVPVGRTDGFAKMQGLVRNRITPFS